MSKAKRLIICFLILLISIGVCGCMNENLNRTEYEKAILSFLEDKYSDKFEIHEMYQEFEGNNGMIVRALCKSLTYADSFTVRCYMDPSVTSEVVGINGKTHAIEDGYGEVVFQNQLLSELTGDSTAEDIVVRCRVEFYGYKPTKEEFRQGLDACIQNEGLKAYVKFYILSGDNARELQTKAETILTQFMPDTGYIYYAVQSPFDRNHAEQMYTENKFDFGNYLTSSDLADKIEFTLYEKDTGLQTRRTIRG